MQTNVSNIIFHQDIAWLSHSRQLADLFDWFNLKISRTLHEISDRLRGSQAQPKDQSAEKSDENANK